MTSGPVECKDGPLHGKSFPIAVNGTFVTFMFEVATGSYAMYRLRTLHDAALASTGHELWFQQMVNKGEGK